mgnify:CR=1 FL=1
MDYNLFDTVKRIWALGKCAIEIIYLFIIYCYSCCIVLFILFNPKNFNMVSKKP